MQSKGLRLEPPALATNFRDTTLAERTIFESNALGGLHETAGALTCLLAGSLFSEDFPEFYKRFQPDHLEVVISDKKKSK